MRIIIFFFILLILLWPESKQSYELKWSDEFNGEYLDARKWNYIFPGEHLDAINTPDAVEVKDGLLRIKTYTKNGIHYSAMISTKDIFEHSFGKWECRARFNNASGTWSDFWLYSWTAGYIENDPNNAGAEIDIFEHRLYNEHGKDIFDIINYCVHWNGYSKNHKVIAGDSGEMGISQGFNVYSLEWTKKEYKFFVNDKLIGKIPIITTKPLFIILSTEVLDNGWAGKIPKNGFRGESFDIDYVRVYSPK